jgi:S-adenosylmethionine:tRNA ribosyltransferase-isomerase
LIETCRDRGGRVIAIGTTVVRALEHAARADGSVRPGAGTATQRIGPLTSLRCVDAIVSGTHEPGTSHYDLLFAFQDGEVLQRMERDADAHGYRTHEFGDSVFLARSRMMSEWDSRPLPGRSVDRHFRQQGAIAK